MNAILCSKWKQKKNFIKRRRELEKFFNEIRDSSRHRNMSMKSQLCCFFSDSYQGQDDAVLGIREFYVTVSFVHHIIYIPLSRGNFLDCMGNV